MKRKLSTTILALSLILGVSTTQINALKFGDLKGYGWAEKYIEDTSSKGIIKGYTDGTFKPGSPVSRIESLVMIANLFPKSDIDATYKSALSKYKKQLDTAKIEEWARPYVVFSLEKGIIPNSDKMISSLYDIKSKKYVVAKRFEVCVFLVRGLGLESEVNKSAKLTYKDSKKILAQAVPYVDMLQRKGVISKLGDGSGNFNPDNTINRAETAVMLSNAYKYSAKAKGVSATIPTATPVTPAPKPIVTPAQPVVENISGKISLITMTDTDLTLSITTDNNQIKNYTAKKNELVVKIGDAISSFTGLKIGQEATFTVNGGKLTQVQSQLETERISGTLEIVSADKGTITVKSVNDVKVLKYDATSQMYLNDAISAVNSLPIGAQIDVYYQGDKVIKANVIYTKSEYKGEIVSYNSTSITVRDEKNNVVTKSLDANAKLYRNEKRVELSDIAIGDTATIRTDNDKIVNVAIETKSGKYTSSTIKSIQMNADYNTITITDREGADHTFTINNTTIIRINDKKDSIYSLKVGYEVDVYTQGGLIEEIISKGDYKQTTISGTVTAVDTVDKFIELKQNDGKMIKLFYTNTTKIEKLSDSKTIDARDIYKGDSVTAIGVISSGNVNATRIIANI